MSAPPQPDYDAHPAYGGRYGSPTLRKRGQSLRRFGSGLRESVSDLARNSAARFLGRLQAISNPLPSEDSRLATLHRDGAMAIRLRPEAMERLREACRPAVARLDAIRGQPKPKRFFKEGSLLLTPETDAELLEIIDAELHRENLFETARSYLGYEVDLTASIRICDTSDFSYWRDRFEEEGLPDPETTYFHIDSTFGLFRGILYLNEVGLENGTFEYVLGSHRMLSVPEMLIRKTNDISGLDGKGRRELFAALPWPLRRKAAFGDDLQDGSPESEFVLSRTHSFTSKDGDLVLFDNCRGMHRGGRCTEGRREVLHLTWHRKEHFTPRAVVTSVVLGIKSLLG